MEKKLDTLMLINYDSANETHRKAKYELLSDVDFQKYFGQFFIKDSDEYFRTSEDLEVKKIYWVIDKDKIIGMIRIFNYHPLGYINIQYAVLPSCRKNGYGKRILEEFSNYLIAQDNIVCIEGDIDKVNLGSIKIAKSIGYSEENGKYKFRK